MKNTILIILCISLFSCNKTKESTSDLEENYDYSLESFEVEKSNNIGNKLESEYNNRVPSYNGESVMGRDYYVGENGRVYENKACGYCSGSGYIQSYDMASGGQVANICNACNGAGQLSY